MPDPLRNSTASSREEQMTNIEQQLSCEPLDVFIDLIFSQSSGQASAVKQEFRKACRVLQSFGKVLLHSKTELAMGGERNKPARIKNRVK